VASNPRIDDLRKRLEKDPGSRLFAQLAEELRKAGELEEAIALSREGLLKHPAYPSARMTLGRALYDRKDFGGARTELEGVLKGAADNILASRLLAECLEGLGDLPAALERYRQTLAMAPGDRLIASKVSALEARLESASRAASAPDARSTPAKPLAPEAPIPLVAAEEAFELERSYEVPSLSTVSAPAAPRPLELPPVADAVPLPEPEPIVEPEPMEEVPEPFAFVPPPPIPEFPEEAVEAPALAPAPLDRTVAPPIASLEPSPAGQLFEFDAPEDISDAATLKAPALVFDEPAAVLPPPADPRPAAVSAGEAQMLPEMEAEPLPPWVAPAGGAPAPEIISSTLAELYFNQGFTEKAVEVYQQVLGREPGNERARARLSELQGSDMAVRVEVAAPQATGGGDGRAARREAIERVITRLEGLRATLRRG
jgi:tetratricopeptide (TPR) repeat protein